MKKSFIQKQKEKALNLLSKAHTLEHKNVLKDDYDNCLLCRHADIQDNEISKILTKWKCIWLADRLNFPVVNCKLSDGKYVANPLKRPGWCRRGNK